MGRPFVTVVSGVPRSGTSLMMQMLAAGGVEVLADETRAPDADNPRGYFELEAVTRSRSDLSWVARAAGKAVKVIHTLVSELPEDHAYRVILMRRDLWEVAASQRAVLDRRGAARDDLPPARLVEILGRQLRELELWIRARPGFGLLVVEYAALVADPAAGARAVDAFLGGGLDREAMARAVDPALYRQRLGVSPRERTP